MKSLVYVKATYFLIYIIKCFTLSYYFLVFFSISFCRDCKHVCLFF